MLPKTFDPAEAEPRLYAAWEASGAFSPTGDPAAEPFSIVIPPPNVTGSLHIGHALNNTLQDVLIRFERMRGKAALWLPGTDHAGIATQMVVERQLAAAGNQGRRELGREAFVERVWAWKAESGGNITRQLRRLGASCDWSRERFTLDEGLSAAVRKVFVTLHRQGLLYRDKRLVNWDPALQTAISDLEVETRETKGQMWHFAYPLEGEPIDGVSEIVIATTRPETMLGDGAVAVHPDDERYRKFVGRMVRLPIADRLIPIIADDYPDPEKGSGAVKITGAHDFNDYGVAVKHGLSLISIMDQHAKMTGPIPDRYVGQDRFVARKMVLEDIEAQGLYRGAEDRVIPVPHGDRSGVVLEPLLTDQWYVNAAELAKEAIAAVEDGRTVFEPRNWEKTYFEWMRNIQPWCVSRQLWWGHRIPAWYGPDGAVFVAETAEDAAEQARVHYASKTPSSSGLSRGSMPGPAPISPSGVGADPTTTSRTTLDPRDKPEDDAEGLGGDSIRLRQDEDVLDTWFSSGLWPFSTLGWPDDTDDVRRFYPTHTLVTGFDIIFFWVARMMMLGLHFTGEAPFKRVVINALVRDATGAKMSKSKGNVLDPLELVDEFGADALRFTLTAMSGQARDIKLSRPRIEGYRGFGAKLWNAARFCELNGCVLPTDFDPAAVELTLNRWIRGETAKAAAAVTRALDAAAFGEAADALYRFIWNVVCDWYVELAKPVLQGPDGPAKDETRATGAWVLDQCLRLLHPVSPFLTEDLWARTGERAGMLITERWPDLPAGYLDAEADAEINWLIRLIEEIRSIRSALNVPVAARTPLVFSGAGAETRARVARHEEAIRFRARVEAVTFADAPPAGAVPFVLGEATGSLAVAGLIDLTAEVARLRKETTAKQKDAEQTRRKLDNADFIARAPEEVVEENRERLADAEAALAKLREALARLEGLETS